MKKAGIFICKKVLKSGGDDSGRGKQTEKRQLQGVTRYAYNEQGYISPI